MKMKSKGDFIMALFNFGKKNKEKKASACCCGGACDTATVEVLSSNTETCCKKTVEGISCIKVLGSGCKSCHTLLESTKEAVNAMGLSIDVEYVTDMHKIMEYGVMSMPALVVNEKVVSMGKVLKAVDVKKLLQKQ